MRNAFKDFSQSTIKENTIWKKRWKCESNNKLDLTRIAEGAWTVFVWLSCTVVNMAIQFEAFLDRQSEVKGAWTVFVWLSCTVVNMAIQFEAFLDRQSEAEGAWTVFVWLSCTVVNTAIPFGAFLDWQSEIYWARNGFSPWSWTEC